MGPRFRRGVRTRGFLQWQLQFVSMGMSGVSGGWGVGEGGSSPFRSSMQMELGPKGGKREQAKRSGQEKP
jgi:hypothetical protein